MLANLLIGLREGLEAALVIGILVAYLVKSDRRDMLRWVWSGVGAAIAVSVGIWALITFTANGMDDEGQEIFAGALSLGAVALVTWMILWMRTAARTLRADLGGKLDKALIAGPAAVLATSFLAVAREGVETALFLWSSMRARTGSARRSCNRSCATARRSSPEV
jgi:high-affinity iron transporter